MAVRSGTNSYDREAVVGCGDSHRPAAAFLPDIVAAWRREWNISAGAGSGDENIQRRRAYDGIETYAVHG